jgi:predicted dehydrogenase
MNLRVGIAGAGQAGDHHAVGFSTTEGAEVVAIADLNKELASSVADRYGASAVTNWQAMLDMELDILVVALPHNLHLEPAEAAASRGIHVLMEKPIAITLKDGKRIVDACNRADVKLTISFVHRYREELQVARQWIDEGAIGTPMVARETMGGQRGAHLGDWVESQEAAGGGVLMYSSIHGLDRLRWLLGSEVATVTAQAVRFDSSSEIESSVSALLTFTNGAVATLNSNAPLYRAQPRFWETEIYGSSGMLRLRTREWAELSSDSRLERIETLTFSDKLGPHYNFGRQAEAFVNAIHHGTDPYVSAKDGIRSLEIALAIYNSADRNEPVHLVEE